MSVLKNICTFQFPLFAALACWTFQSISNANPIFVSNDTYVATKLWERCLAAVNSKGAAISCAIGYGLKPDQSTKAGAARRFNIVLPVFMPRGAAQTEKELLNLFAPKLEENGSVITPRYAEILPDSASRAAYRAPWGAQVVFFTFDVQSGHSKEGTSLVVTYQQPLINGAFHYLPLFENDQNPPENAEFSFTAFPSQSDITLRLKSENRSVRSRAKTRITLNLRQRELISIKPER